MLNQQQAELDITVQEFLDEIFYELPEGEHICLTRSKTSGGMIQGEPGDKSMRNVMKGTDALPAYFNTCTIEPRRDDDPYLRRTADRAKRCYCVVLDDIGDADNSKAKEPPVHPA